MKYLYILCSILFCSSIGLRAQYYEKNCFYGMTFEVSQNSNWGKGELVITGIEPYSAAETAGIKVGDIIMEINGKATYLRDNQTIANWLFNADDPTVNFTVRNMNTYFKEYPLQRKCVAVNSISEKEISNLLSFYSFENTNQQSFTLPIKIEINSEADYADYHTYDFHRDEKPHSIDTAMMRILEVELTKRGLVRDTKDPDLIVQTYFGFDSNPKYKASTTTVEGLADILRYDVDQKQMVFLPFIDSKNTENIKLCPYIYEIGFGIYDIKHLKPGKMVQIWDSSIKDYVFDKFSYKDYIRVHIPLMAMQFPYTKEKKEAKYIASFDRYNYTGMHFDADDMVTVRDVDFDSPAYKAGIRPGYVIKKIDNKKFDHTKISLTDGYKLFVTETMKYRDASTRFTNAQGYADCMFWAMDSYSDIQKAFNNNRYQANFSYLYNFEKFVNSKPPTHLTIEAFTGRQLRTFMVTPILQQSVALKAVY